MKKIRKGKKLLAILLIVIVVIIATVVIINIAKKQPTPVQPEENAIIPIPEITYSDMQVKNIQMEYLKDNNQTEIRMEIHNTTSNKVEEDKFDVVWIGPKGETLGKINTQIKNLDVGEQNNISVILPGNLTTTKEIKLIKK